MLHSTDPKHYKFTMTVIADDKSIDKKDRNVDEPMQFYVRGVRAPYELVVMDVSKNGVNGYLTTPKETGGPSGGLGRLRRRRSLRLCRSRQQPGCSQRSGGSASFAIARFERSK